MDLTLWWLLWRVNGEWQAREAYAVWGMSYQSLEPEYVGSNA